MHGLLIPVPFYFFPWYYLTYFETTNFVPIVRTTSGAIFMSIEIDSLRKIMTEWSSGVRRKPRENISREKKEEKKKTLTKRNSSSRTHTHTRWRKRKTSTTDRLFSRHLERMFSLHASKQQQIPRLFNYLFINFKKWRNEQNWNDSISTILTLWSIRNSNL